MKTVLLLRHAKSDWGDPGLDDFDRVLAPRGERAAQLLGAYMAQLALRPDLVLCSPAVRTRRTWAFLSDRLGDGIPFEAHEALYLAEPAVILDLIQTTAPDSHVVMVIGHNPGIGALAVRMAADGSADDIRAMAEKYPTGALAEIQFGVGAWNGIDQGKLVRFIRPRDLDADRD